MNSTDHQLYLLAQRVFMLEQALQKHGITVEKFPQHQVEECEPESAQTPAQQRALGRAYCPACYTFGSDHRKGCKNASAGMTKHVTEKP